MTFTKILQQLLKPDFDTSSHELDRPLPGKKNVIGLMKDELGEKIMIKMNFFD